MNKSDVPAPATSTTLDSNGQSPLSAMAKAYEPSQVEGHWYNHWLQAGHFQADSQSDKPPFCIVIPPPNVTGSLHMGHALTVAIQDALIRWRRMCGFNTLWLPGTDHAGIATQMVVERALLAEEGLSRHDLGRAEFLRRVWKWKEQYGGRITEQLKVIGCSVDWSRERFTLDPGMSRAVREVFVRLFEEGLIYRAERLINWCPRCQTALSDLEVDHQENVKGTMWDFAYQVEGGRELVVSTTRPETMLGDTAVAVHPDDPRYQDLIGKCIRHPFVDRTFPIIGDAILVDPKFGTGAVKVTPAHDFNDFDTGTRHNLPMVNILHQDGTLNENGGPFQGMPVLEARQAVLKALKEKGLYRGEKDHLMALGGCQRCEAVVEPYLSLQWFVKTEPLAAPAMEAVRKGKTTIIPQSFEKVYFHWMENIRDWCISRQLWWGHRIPAWTCTDCDHLVVNREDPDQCPACQGSNLVQDEDVLDTWFSSALWPFSTLGWPEHTEDLRTFYPTSVMETGFDILFFWVARMMMMGIHFMGEVPFADVYLHGMVRDAHGHKMSKTRGNVIDPLLITDRFGADALRFTLASLAAPGRDVKLNEEWVAGYRNFCNKIWNAARFALPFIEKTEQPAQPDPVGLPNRWIISRLERVVEEVNAGMEEFRLNDATSAVYQFFWHELCDWYLELCKPILYERSGTEEERESTKATLAWVLDTALRLLHPFMCFITEEIWQRLPRRRGETAPSIMVASFPKPRGERAVDLEAEAAIDLIIGVVTAIRTLRSESNVPTHARPNTLVLSTDQDVLQVLESQHHHVVELCRLEALRVGNPLQGDTPPKGAVKALVSANVEVWLPLVGLIDLDAEAARLHKEITRMDGELERAKRKLENRQFLEKAPAEVVAKEQARATDLAKKREQLVAGARLIEDAKSQ